MTENLTLWAVYTNDDLTEGRGRQYVKHFCKVQATAHRLAKGDRAFVGNALMNLREKGYLLRKRDAVDDDDDPRGIADYDTISDAGRDALAASEARP